MTVRAHKNNFGLARSIERNECTGMIPEHCISALHIVHRHDLAAPQNPNDAHILAQAGTDCSSAGGEVFAVTPKQQQSPTRRALSSQRCRFARRLQKTGRVGGSVAGSWSPT